MSNNEGRPGAGRIAPNADTGELMAIMEEFPNWGIAQARDELNRRRQQAQQEAQENSAPQNTAAPQARDVWHPAPAPVQDNIAETRMQQHHHAAPVKEEATQPPVSPDPVAEPAAPSFLPSAEEQPAPEVRAPQQPAPAQPKTPEPPVAKDQGRAEPLTQESDEEERVPNYNGKVQPPMRHGSSVRTSEINELEAESQDILMLGLGDLLGPMQPVSEMQGAVNRFFASLERDPRNNAPLFRNEREEQTFKRLQATLFTTPPSTPGTSGAAFDLALARQDTVWNQGMQKDGDSYAGLVTSKSNGKGALAALRRKRKSGSPSTVFLPASGFIVKFRAPHERDFCDFDIAMALETAKVGVNSYGLLMSASSGIYVRNIIEFCLQFVEATSLEIGGDDLKNALIDRIDKDDYWLLIVGMLAAKFPSGIPWGLSCLNPECDHVSEGRLNLARAIRMGSSLISDEQRALYYRQRGDDDNTISYEDQAEYRQKHQSVAASVFETDGVRVEFGRCSLGDFFDVTEEWKDEINETTTRALTDYATEKDRENHLRVNAESRRLTRYLHMVKSITIDEGDGKVSVATTREEIKTMLGELSPDRTYVAEFEAAVTKFTEMSRLAVFGYMGKNCPHCGKEQGEKNGDFRGIVTISPDRLFFVLSRAVSAMQRLWLNQYADIG